MTVCFNSVTRGAATVPHGSIHATELAQWGLDPADVVDFSTNVNPFGPAPAVVQALREVDWTNYPDPDATALRERLAAHHGTSPDRILAGNGTAELIWLVALAFLAPGRRALVVEPTFGEYARAARIAGAEVVTVRQGMARDWAIGASEIGRALAASTPAVAFFCHPNNPTGTLLPLDVLGDWAARYLSTLFVVDEAYIDFAEGAESALSLGRPNILVLRSLTKTHALAGLRLGYAVAAPNVVDALRRVAPPWSVNSGAQAAGIVALKQAAWLGESLGRLWVAKRDFAAALRRIGYEPAKSATHYFLLPVENGADFRRRLLPRGIVVRDCASFGLPGHVRVATRRREENSRLIHEIQRLGDC